MTAFLEPMLAAVTEQPATCRVFALGPDGGDGSEFALPMEECEAYCRFTIAQGFKLGARLLSTSDAREVILVTWEGAAVDVPWPSVSGQILGEWVWHGYQG